MLNVYKDDIDPMHVQREAFSMSTIFQRSNSKNFYDFLEQLESLHPTKYALIPNFLTTAHLIFPMASCNNDD